MFRTTNFQMVEIPVNSTNATGANSDIPFLQQPQLQTPDKDGRRIYIKAIEVFSNAALISSPITTTNPTASPFDITNATVTFMEGTSANKNDMPLAMLNRAFATGVGFVAPPIQLFLLKNVYTIDWTRSFITVLTVPPVLPFSYLFGVHYSYDPDLY